MPKELIKRAKLIVVEEAGKQEARTLDGKPTGIYARATHEYVPGEVLNLGDVIEESASFGINWTKMGDPTGGYAQLHVSIPRDLIERVMEDLGNGEGPVEFYSDYLSRADLNRMVTLGRHVRDSAHGQDA